MDPLHQLQAITLSILYLVGSAGIAFLVKHSQQWVKIGEARLAKEIGQQKAAQMEALGEEFLTTVKGNLPAILFKILPPAKAALAMQIIHAGEDALKLAVAGQSIEEKPSTLQPKAGPAVTPTTVPAASTPATHIPIP